MVGPGVDHEPHRARRVAVAAEGELLARRQVEGGFLERLALQVQQHQRRAAATGGGGHDGELVAGPIRQKVAQLDQQRVAAQG